MLYSLCWLYDDSFESRHLLRVFGRAEKDDSDKILAWRFRSVCRIFITENRSLWTLICRSARDLRLRRVNLDKEVKLCKRSWLILHVKESRDVS